RARALSPDPSGRRPRRRRGVPARSRVPAFRRRRLHRAAIHARPDRRAEPHRARMGRAAPLRLRAPPRAHRELPRHPPLRRAAAPAMPAAKVGRNLPALLLLLLTGPRALFLGAIPLWAIVARPPRALAAAALTALSLVGVSLLAAAASVPLSRYLYPARVAGEAAGLLALWGLISRAPQGAVGPGAGRVLRAAVAGVAIAWGGLQTARGAAEARAVARERGVPTTQ